MGANCGVGASDLLFSLVQMSQANPGPTFIAKANAGIPQFRGEHIHYSGTPELMADYARLARMLARASLAAAAAPSRSISSRCAPRWTATSPTAARTEPRSNRASAR
jgi:hypothetical protein